MFRVISRQRHQAPADPTHYRYTDQSQPRENSETGEHLQLPYLTTAADHRGEFTSSCVLCAFRRFAVVRGLVSG